MNSINERVNVALSLGVCSQHTEADVLFKIDGGKSKSIIHSLLRSAGKRTELVDAQC